MGPEAVVEGDWKEYQFKMVTPEDIPRVLEVLRKFFYPYETLTTSLLSNPEEFEEMAKDFEPTVRAALKDNISFFVEHKESKTVAGVRVLSIVKRGHHEEDPPILYPPDKIVVGCLTQVTKAADIFTAFPDVDKYVDLVMTVTDPTFRGQGLATEMYRRAMDLVKALGIPLCKSVLTSPFTMKACRNLKFVECSKLFLQDYKDENGVQYFPDAKPDQFITVVAKRIE